MTSYSTGILKYFSVVPSVDDNQPPTKKQKTRTNTNIIANEVDVECMLVEERPARSTKSTAKQPQSKPATARKATSKPVNKRTNTPFQPNVIFPQTHYVDEQVEALWNEKDDFEGMFFDATVTLVHADGYCDLVFSEDGRTRVRVPPSELKKKTGEQELSSIQPPMERVVSHKEKVRKANYSKLSNAKDNLRKEVKDPRKFIKDYPDDGLIIETIITGMSNGSLLLPISFLLLLIVCLHLISSYWGRKRQIVLFALPLLCFCDFK